MRKWLVGGMALLVTGALSFGGESPLRAPEDTRQALYDLMDRFEAAAPSRLDVALHAERVRRALDGMSAQQLEVLHETYAGARSVQQALGFDGDLRRPEAPWTSNVITPRAEPVYSAECGSERTDAATAQEQLDSWQELQVAAATAQGECDAAPAEDKATVCPVAAMANEAALVARFVYEATLLCNRDIDAAEIAAILGTVDELQAAVGNLGGDIPDLLDALRTAILDALAAHDQAIQDALAAHDAAVAAAIAAHDAEIKAALEGLASNQQTILEQLGAIRQLLLTPFGRRPGWNDRPNDPPQNPGNGNGS